MKGVHGDKEKKKKDKKKPQEQAANLVKKPAAVSETSVRRVTGEMRGKVHVCLRNLLTGADEYLDFPRPFYSGQSASRVTRFLSSSQCPERVVQLFSWDGS